VIKMKKLFTLSILLLFIVLLFVGCQKEIEEEYVPRPVRVMKVGDVGGISQRWLPGRASASQEVNLSFRVSGPLTELPVKVGDEVKQGQLLARIDPRDFEVSLRNAEGQLAKAEAALQFAEAEYGRVVRIREQDPAAISESMVDRKRQEMDAAQAQLVALEADIDAARDRLDYTYMRAPFSGTIVATYVENYEEVQAKQIILRLLDPTSVEMTVDVPENIISYIPYVQNIRVRFDSFPALVIPAEVLEIGTEASTTTRTYPVTFIMEQPEEATILAGMTGELTGDVVLPEEQQEPLMEVPTTALFSDETGLSYVWVINLTDNTVHKREVKLGKLTDYGITIMRGLDPGEYIATAGVHYLEEGQEVRILGEKAGEASS
jgi:RND family efflux transporter MFP subunit